MTNNDYAEFVDTLSKPGQEIAENMSGAEANLLHMAVGVSGEAGELLDAIKKHVIYKKPLDRANVIEEVGDILFYLQGLLNEVDSDFDTCVRLNMSKLQQRYPNGYTNKAAQERADK